MSRDENTLGRYIIIAVIFLAAILTSIFITYKCSTNEGGSSSKRRGHSYAESGDWYEEQGETDKELYVDFTSSDVDLSKNYVVPNYIDYIVFSGVSYRVYENFSILISPRSSRVEVEMRNFSYTAPSGKVAFDASGVSDNYKVYFTVEGMVKISGGCGNDGTSGMGYSATSSTRTPRDGEEGTDGTDGAEAAKFNSVDIKIKDGAQLILIGGNGGNGGDGGQGEGSNAPGNPRAGTGGAGGSGGVGASAIVVKGDFEINNGGTFSAYGGVGGNGGNAGNGGTATVKYPTDRFDDGGYGGNGGNGGAGAPAVVAVKTDSMKIVGKQIDCVAGNGGNGGRGGNGGKTGKNIMGKGTPGDGGRGGNGGDGAIDSLVHNLVSVSGSDGGKGGTGGNAGTGDHVEGAYGRSGNGGRSFK